MASRPPATGAPDHSTPPAKPAVEGPITSSKRSARWLWLVLLPDRLELVKLSELSLCFGPISLPRGTPLRWLRFDSEA